jgi:hypothetical protein
VIRTLRRFILTGGALLLPLFVCAHNGEFLLAKLQLHPDGSCTLKVTADAEANFNIQDRAQMMEAAPRFFELSSGKETRSLSKIAGEPTYSTAPKLDPDAPLGHSPEELAKRYRLEIVEWNWVPDTSKFVLRVPEMSPHTFILWLVDERVPAPKPRWVMMIAEDESPLIELSKTTEAPRDGWDILLIALVAFTIGTPLLGSVFVWYKNRQLSGSRG